MTHDSTIEGLWATALNVSASSRSPAVKHLYSVVEELAAYARKLARERAENQAVMTAVALAGISPAALEERPTLLKEMRKVLEDVQRQMGHTDLCLVRTRGADAPCICVLADIDALLAALERDGAA